jgi:hypothetical protein
MISANEDNLPISEEQEPAISYINEDYSKRSESVAKEMNDYDSSIDDSIDAHY